MDPRDAAWFGGLAVLGGFSAVAGWRVGLSWGVALWAITAALWTALLIIWDILQTRRRIKAEIDRESARRARNVRLDPAWRDREHSTVRFF
jgi:hypothetical protein